MILWMCLVLQLFYTIGAEGSRLFFVGRSPATHGLAMLISGKINSILRSQCEILIIPEN